MNKFDFKSYHQLLESKSNYGLREIVQPTDSILIYVRLFNVTCFLLGAII